LLVVLRTENPRAIIRFKFFCRVRPEFNLILDTLDILLLLSYKQPSKREVNAKDPIVQRVEAPPPGMNREMGCSIGMPGTNSNPPY